MLCIPIKGPSLTEAIEQIILANERGDLIELRLDLFESHHQNEIERLMNASKKPLIFTLRRQEKTSVTEWMKNIEILASLSPSFLDIDCAAPTDFFVKIKREYPKISVICSYHNHQETPEDLPLIYETMLKKPADYYKLCPTANSTNDTLRLIGIIKNAKAKTIGCAMGKAGLLSRVITPLITGLWTYASLDKGLETALGQLTAQELLDIYRIHELSATADLLGLMGFPVSKSIGHLTHNQLLKKNRINGVYVKTDVEKEEIKSFLTLCKKAGYRGLGVTMPLKEAVIPHLDEIDEEAKAIGAVNTISFENGKIKGYTTDGKGALDALETKGIVKGKSIVILGAGGAARSIIFEAIKRGAKVTVANRTLSKAKELAKKWGVTARSLTDLPSSYDILINTTPLSMPIEHKNIHSGAVIMDINTKPLESELIKAAKEMGAAIVYGYEMFVMQAVWQFMLWYPQDLYPKKVEEILFHESEHVLF